MWKGRSNLPPHCCAALPRRLHVGGVAGAKLLPGERSCQVRRIEQNGGQMLDQPWGGISVQNGVFCQVGGGREESHRAPFRAGNAFSEIGTEGVPVACGARELGTCGSVGVWQNEGAGSHNFLFGKSCDRGALCGWGLYGWGARLLKRPTRRDMGKAGFLHLSAKRPAAKIIDFDREAWFKRSGPART